MSLLSILNLKGKNMSNERGNGLKPDGFIMDDLGYQGYCKIGQPIMSAEKAAELYYKRADILDKGIFMLNKISNNKFMFSHVDDYNNGKVNATARPCIFLNKETGECMLGDDKPNTCSGTNVIKPMIMKDILKVSFTNKDLKKRMHRFKEDLILYLTVWHLNKILENEDTVEQVKELFNIEYKYKLVMTDKNVITSLRYTKLTSKRKEYEAVAKIYNTISRNMLVLSPSYLTTVVHKLNSFIKAGNFKTCENDLTLVEKASVYLLSMFRLYITEYKNKSKEFTGVVNGMSTYKFLKDINEELGGNEDGSIFKREKLQCIIDNNMQMYKIIMKNK
jgi:Fe-S-cluster containining protein